jgi:hypothetical protein
MISAPIIELIEKLLKGSAQLTALVPKTSINYARGPVNSTWPQVNFFEVAATEGYQVDFNSCTVQISAWALDAKQALKIKEIIHSIICRFRGKVIVTDGEITVTWSELIDSGAMPENDPQLYGQYVRYLFRYRGKNIGGI